MNIKSGLTAVFEKAGNEYIGYIEEARLNLEEALELILEVRRGMAKEEQAGRTIIKEEIRMVAR